MKYENPNNAAFFFDDGDFLNLEEVAAVQLHPDGRDDVETGETTGSPTIDVFTRGVEKPICREGPEHASLKEFRRLSDALRVYHSKL
jgi:hypothetical protein